MVYFIIFLVFFILYIIQGINPFRISALKSIAEKEINKGKNSILFSSLKFNNIPEIIMKIINQKIIIVIKKLVKNP